MVKQRHFLRSLAVCALLVGPVLAGPTQAQDVTMKTVVATVGSDEITMAHVMNVKRTLPEQYRTLPNDVLLPGIVDQLIQQSVLAQSIDTAPAFLTSAIENEERNLLANYAIQQMSNTEVSDVALQDAYDERFGAVEAAREFNASHILVETEEEASALVAELDAGADFAELAQAKSTGPSGPSGGALGWFGPGAMVPTFEEAVVALTTGQVSAPVQTQFGWHVIRLNETRVVEAPTLSEVREDLVQEIRSQALQAAMAALLDKANPVKTEGIDPEVLSVLEFEGQ